MFSILFEERLNLKIRATFAKQIMKPKDSFDEFRNSQKLERFHPKLLES